MISLFLFISKLFLTIEIRSVSGIFPLVESGFQLSLG